jgi:hypothetical protein
MTGCAAILQSPEEGKTGTVTFTVGVEQGRTAAPSLDQFAKIVLSFEGSPAVADVPVTKGKAAAILPAGSWKVRAKAYKGAEDTDPAAQSAENAIEYNGASVSGNTVFVLVPAGEGPGTLRYLAALPEGLALNGGSSITITQDGAAPKSLDNDDFADGVHTISEAGETVTAELDGGWYTVDILLASDGGRTAVFRQNIRILPGLVTEIDFAPAAEDFLSFEARAALTSLASLTFDTEDEGVVVGDLANSGENYSLEIAAPKSAETVTFALAKPETYTVTVDEEYAELASLTDAGAGSASAAITVDTASLAEGDIAFALTVTAEGKTAAAIAVTVVEKSYSIIIAAMSNGGVIANPETAKEGAEVSLEVNPVSDYRLKLGSLKVNSGAVSLSGSGPYTFTMPASDVTVTAEFEENYTAEVEIGDTGANSSNVAMTPPEDEGAPYAMEAVEKGLVYFKIVKTAAQTITPEGPNAAKVTVHTSDTVDGETASETTAVIAVKTGALPFEGGTLNFDLRVSEDGMLSRTVGVAMTITTAKTGGAVFKVTRPEGQTYANGDDGAVLERVDSQAATFEAAVTWVENNAVADTEYLVRVENNDTSLKKYILAFNNANNVTMRLKGSKTNEDGETWSRILRHGGSNTIVNIKKVTTSGYVGFFNIGIGTVTVRKMTFVLDSNITLEGMGSSTASSRYRNLITVRYNAIFVLREGATITNFYTEGAMRTFCPIYVVDADYGDDYNDAAVRLEGGSITNCKFNDVAVDGEGVLSIGAGGLITFESIPSEYNTGCFYKAASVVLSGNVNLQEENANKVVFGAKYPLVAKYEGYLRTAYAITAGEMSLPAEAAE